MFPRKPLANRLKPVDPRQGRSHAIAPRQHLCHPAVQACKMPSAAWHDHDPFQGRLPGFAEVGHFFGQRRPAGQSPADALLSVFRPAVVALDSRQCQPCDKGQFPCVSPFLFSPSRPRPSPVAGRPISSGRSSVPPLVLSSPMPRAAARWPVRQRAALPGRCATISTSANDRAKARLNDSRLSNWPSLPRQGWPLHWRGKIAGDLGCSRRS